MLAAPCFDSAFEKTGGEGRGGEGWRRLVSVTFLQFCIAACLGFWHCFTCFEDERIFEPRERFKGACVLFHPGDHMQSG